MHNKYKSAALAGKRAAQKASEQLLINELKKNPICLSKLREVAKEIDCEFEMIQTSWQSLRRKGLIDLKRMGDFNRVHLVLIC